MTVSFVDNALNETGFVVERATSANGPFTQVGTSGQASGTGGTVTVVDSTAAANTTYYYRAYAVNGSQASYIAGPSPVTTPASGGTGGTTNPGGPPNGPFNLQLAATSPTSVQVSFIDNADNETGFVVERSTSPSGTFTQVGTAAPSAGVHATVTVVDNTAAAGTIYYYRAYAVNGPYQSYIAGPSPITTPGSGTTLALPTNLTATVHSVPIGDPNGPVYYADVTFTDPGGYSQFVIQSTVNGVPVADRTVAAAGAGNTVEVLPVLQNQSTTTFRVYGVTAGGQSGPVTQPVVVSTPGAVNPGGAPNGPFNLNVAKVAGGVQISFTDNSDNETGFVVERSTSQNGTYSPVGATGPSASTLGTVSVFDGTAAAGTTYFYRTYAVNGPYQSGILGPTSVLA